MCIQGETLIKYYLSIYLSIYLSTIYKYIYTIWQHTNTYTQFRQKNTDINIHTNKYKQTV